jgi:phage terminase small subunit
MDASNLSGSGVNPKDTAIPASASDEWAKKLSDKERLFVEGYLQTLNKRQAAEYAGYTKATANRRAFDVFNRPHVREAIELLLQTRAGVTKAWIIDQLVEIAQAKATDLYEWGATGVRLKNSDEIAQDRIGAVAEIEETHVVDKKGNDIVTIKVKTHSRHQALKDLAKIFRMEVERQEISGPAGGPIEVIDHKARITDRLNGIARRKAASDDGASGDAD